MGFFTFAFEIVAAFVLAPALLSSGAITWLQVIVSFIIWLIVKEIFGDKEADKVKQAQQAHLKEKGRGDFKL